MGCRGNATPVRARSSLRLFVTVCAVCAVTPGCLSFPAPTPLESAPPIAGTLYITHLSQSSGAPDVTTVRDGAVVSSPAPSGVLIARDKPSVTFPTAPLRGRRQCEPVAISPHGGYGACLRADGHGSVIIFRLANPASTQVQSPAQVTINSNRMAGFLNERQLAVAADDDSCPSYHRGDARRAYEPRARLWVIGTDGVLERRGPCIHGLVAGTKRIAFIFHDSKERPTYSFDGKTWQYGLATTFDGSDRLLVINEWDQLVDEKDRLVAKDVADAVWTR